MDTFLLHSNGSQWMLQVCFELAFYFRSHFLNRLHDIHVSLICFGISSYLRQGCHAMLVTAGFHSFKAVFISHAACVLVHCVLLVCLLEVTEGYGETIIWVKQHFKFLGSGGNLLSFSSAHFLLCAFVITLCWQGIGFALSIWATSD